MRRDEALIPDLNRLIRVRTPAWLVFGPVSQAAAGRETAAAAIRTDRLASDRRNAPLPLPSTSPATTARRRPAPPARLTPTTPPTGARCARTRPGWPPDAAAHAGPWRSGPGLRPTARPVPPAVGLSGNAAPAAAACARPIRPGRSGHRRDGSRPPGHAPPPALAADAVDAAGLVAPSSVRPAGPSPDAA